MYEVSEQIDLDKRSKDNVEELCRVTWILASTPPPPTTTIGT